MKRTVLILGAGASKPYGLPLGWELRDDVLNASKNIVYQRQMHACGKSETVFRHFCDDLTQSGFSSVDAFLEQRPRWTTIGKFAMALSLLASEYHAKDKLFPPHEPKDHWYEVLWWRLKAPSWSAFKRQPVSIVTFNYDRALEHYLSCVLSNNYSIRPETARAALPILHVHGSLGEYDGSFGWSAGEKMPLAAADSIRVVHEADLRHSGFVQARKLLSAAERILFIGFGYHDANMRKLGFEGKRRYRSADPRILGTHKGIKARTWERICHKYYFAFPAKKHGAGSISECVAEWLA